VEKESALSIQTEREEKRPRNCVNFMRFQRGHFRLGDWEDKRRGRQKENVYFLRGEKSEGVNGRMGRVITKIEE